MNKLRLTSDAIYHKLSHVHDIVMEYGPRHDDWRKISYDDCYDLLNDVLDKLPADIQNKDVTPQKAIDYLAMALSNVYCKSFTDICDKPFELSTDDSLRSFLVIKEAVDHFDAVQHKPIAMGRFSPIMKIFPYFAHVVKDNMQKFNIEEWITKSAYSSYDDYDDHEQFYSTTDRVLHALQDNSVTRKVMHECLIDKSQTEYAVHWVANDNHALMTYKNIENKSIEFIYGAYQKEINDYDVCGNWNVSSIHTAPQYLVDYYSRNNFDISKSAQQYDLSMLEKFSVLLNNKKSEINNAAMDTTNNIKNSLSNASGLCNAQHNKPQ